MVDTLWCANLTGSYESEPLEILELEELEILSFDCSQAQDEEVILLFHWKIQVIYVNW